MVAHEATSDRLKSKDGQPVNDYDCGLINDYGGGNVVWWQDYIRSVIGSANQHWGEAYDAEAEHAALLEERCTELRSKLDSLTKAAQKAIENGQEWNDGTHIQEQEMIDLKAAIKETA